MASKTHKLILLFAGDQSVQSQVQPKYQHDQEVHRSAHRQAVHRAEPDLGGRVQLRGLGLAGCFRGGPKLSHLPDLQGATEGRRFLPCRAVADFKKKKTRKRNPTKSAKDENERDSSFLS